MADEVIIKGIGNNEGQFPDWATEKTLKDLLKVASKEDKYAQAMLRHLAAISSGTKTNSSEYKQLIKEMRETRKKDEAERKKARDDTRKQQDSNDKQLKQSFSMTKLLTGMVTEVSGLRQDMEDFEKSRSKDFKRLENVLKDSGMDAGAVDNLMGMLSKGAGKLNVVAQAAGAAFAAIGAVEGGAQLLFSAIDERFNLATELRQRGVFSAFEDVNTNLQSFAEEVMNNTFSLEQSAEMVRNFSQSVGVYGVHNAMRFTEALRDEGQYIERYGANFNQLINLTGEFLDVQKSLRALDTLDDANRVRRMDEFMDTIALTSNVLKVGMEDAAAIIKDTLEGTDMKALLATVGRDLTEDQKTNISAIQGIFEQRGAGQFGEMISLLSMAGEGAFATQEFSNFAGALGIQNVGILEDIAGQFRASGFDQQAMGEILARELPRLQDSLNQAGINELALTDQDTRQMIAQIVNANAGDFLGAGNIDANRAPPEDAAVAMFGEARRMQDMLMENILTRVVTNMDDLATTMSGQTVAVSQLNTAIQNTFAGIAPGAASLADFVLEGRELVLSGATTTLNGVNNLLGFEAEDGTLPESFGVMQDAANKQLMAARSFERSVKASISGEYSDMIDPELAVRMQSNLNQIGGYSTVDPNNLPDDVLRQVEERAIRRRFGRGRIDGLARGSDEYNRLLQVAKDDNEFTRAKEDVLSQLQSNGKFNGRGAEEELRNDLRDLFLMNEMSMGAMSPEAIKEFLEREKVFTTDVTPEMFYSALNSVVGASTNIVSPDRMQYLVEQLFGETGESAYGKTMDSSYFGFSTKAGWEEEGREGTLNAEKALQEMQTQNTLLRNILTQMERTARNTNAMNE